MTKPKPDWLNLSPLWVGNDVAEAFRAGVKRTHRVRLTAHNSIVHPGQFEGLNLETGRRRSLPQHELRARCEFKSGKARAVTVSPKVTRGDLFWIRQLRVPAKDSDITLEVLGVDVRRLQDMTDEEARAEGAGMLRPQFREYGGMRDWYAMSWDHAAKSRELPAWRENPWVWVYRLKVHQENFAEVVKKKARL